MSRYDVLAGPGGVGLVLDVQTDLIAILSTRAVVPLVDAATIDRVHPRLNPELTIEGTTYVLATQQIAAVRASSLGTPHANVEDQSDRITRALDMLFQGF